MFTTIKLVLIRTKLSGKMFIPKATTKQYSKRQGNYNGTLGNKKGSIGVTEKQRYDIQKIAKWQA